MFFDDYFSYRVRFESEGDDQVCVIEADGPINTQKMRAFIEKTRRVYNLDPETKIRVIELRKVIERHDLSMMFRFAEMLDNRQDTRADTGKQQAS